MKMMDIGHRDYVEAMLLEMNIMESCMHAMRIMNIGEVAENKIKPELHDEILRDGVNELPLFVLGSSIWSLINRGNDYYLMRKGYQKHNKYCVLHHLNQADVERILAADFDQINKKIQQAGRRLAFLMADRREDKVIRFPEFSRIDDIFEEYYKETYAPKIDLKRLLKENPEKRMRD